MQSNDTPIVQNNDLVMPNGGSGLDQNSPMAANSPLEAAQLHSPSTIGIPTVTSSNNNPLINPSITINPVSEQSVSPSTTSPLAATSSAVKTNIDMAQDQTVAVNNISTETYPTNDPSVSAAVSFDPLNGFEPKNASVQPAPMPNIDSNVNLGPTTSSPLNTTTSVAIDTSSISSVIPSADVAMSSNSSVANNTNISSVLPPVNTTAQDMDVNVSAVGDINMSNANTANNITSNLDNTMNGIAPANVAATNTMSQSTPLGDNTLNTTTNSSAPMNNDMATSQVSAGEKAIDDFCNTLLSEKGYDNIDPMQRNVYKQELMSEIEDLTNTTIVNSLDDKHLEEFESKLDAGMGPDELMAYVSTIVPNITSILSETYARYRQEYLKVV